MVATPTSDLHRPAPVTFLAALRFWFKLGCISFGGPAGQIALMHRELVEQKRWISEKRFLHALNYCMLLPGPEAQQLATYIGWLMHRTWGGVVAGVLFVLPSLLLLIALSAVYMAWGTVPAVAGVLWGIKPAVAALVLQAVHRMASKTMINPRSAPVLPALGAMSFIAIAFLNVPFPAVVLVAAVCGWLVQRHWPEQFSGAGSHGASSSAQGDFPPAWIDDNTPTPEHARYARSRLVRVLAAGALLWMLPMGVLVAWQGWDGALAQMGWFFTKAALLTFGGAYAVLPYVYQGAVEHFGWLSAAQMMDGLALGESTPGPLIMVVAFVGFVGGWGQQALASTGAAAETLFWIGALAATVVTWFTFLPSFVLILAGGPLVESTHGKLHFTAPLAAIGAAVVGVVASLALFFIVHVALPAGPSGPVDLAGIALVLAAAVALLRFKRGVLEVLAVCAAVGWVTTLV